MKIIIACGASGGHIFPGIALAQELMKRDNETAILIVSTPKAIDIDILKKSGFAFKTLPYTPRSIASLFPALFLSIKLVAGFRPDCVVGFGGFVSGPVVFAGWLLGVPTIIHEQNFIAGLANRIESLFAKRVAVSFEETKDYFNKEKAVKVGNPVRPGFLNLDKLHSRDRFGLDRDRFTLLVLGGSQGASFINSVVADALATIDYGHKRLFQVIHVTGKRDYELIKAGYAKDNIKSKTYLFLDEIDRAYTASDLVITRAGATTLAELAYFGKPSLLIPYPVEKVHQRENAAFFFNNKAALFFEEKDLSADRLREIFLGLIADPKRLNEMADNARDLSNPDAARLLADEVLRLGRRDARH